MVTFQSWNTYVDAWLAHFSRRRLLTRAIRSAHIIWAQRFPRLANSGFDTYFFLNDAYPLLASMIDGFLVRDPALLIQKWANCFGLSDEKRARALADHRAAAADFLYILKTEFASLAALAAAKVTRVH